ncbi:hypothetical protein ACFROC_01775 [Nocardia tengchongensis]|uniref:hypothetical protein n=1 Tax=Nocardia tengchongensis TaxID=2055889 RepID=UPI0036C9C4B5
MDRAVNLANQVGELLDRFERLVTAVQLLRCNKISIDLCRRTRVDRAKVSSFGQ